MSSVPARHAIGFNFILQPEFPLNALVLASEALRIANQNSGRDLFDARLVSETGDPVRASNGFWLSADCSLADMPPADVTLVFGGNLPVQQNSARLLARLRAAARFGATIGAVDTGAFALAQAGLVGEGTPLVLHWEAAPAFREDFPHCALAEQIYLVSKTRVFAAGGVAALDLMLDLIARFEGPALATEVANALVHQPRAAATPQRAPARPEAAPRLAARAPAGETIAARMIATMEANLDFPLSLDGLAERLGVSPRSLVRHSRRALGDAPMRAYLKLRLQAARNLLFYEDFSIKDVATACGFSYPSVFARAFRLYFGRTPRQFRDQVRGEQRQVYRPEMRRLGRQPPPA